MSISKLGDLNKLNNVVTEITSGNGISTESEAISVVIDSSDKVLSVNTNGLLSNISLVIIDNYLKLIGKNNQVISSVPIDDFIKDGMLDSAEVVVNPEGQAPGTYIKLVFNTAAGKDPIYINITSLIDVYTAGNGLNLVSGEFSIKLDGTTLALSSSGLKVGTLTENDIPTLSQSKVTNLTTDLENKVNKDGSKVLSANDFTDEYKTQVDINKTNISAIESLITVYNWEYDTSANRAGPFTILRFKPSVFTDSQKSYIKSFQVKCTDTTPIPSDTIYCILRNNNTILAYSDGQLMTANEYSKFTFDRLIELDKDTQYNILFSSSKYTESPVEVGFRLSVESSNQDIYPVRSDGAEYPTWKPATKFEYYIPTRLMNLKLVEESGDTVEYAIPYISKTVLS